MKRRSGQARARGRFGGLLRERGFRLFWIGETVNELGSATATFGVPLLSVLFVHATTFEVGLLTAAGWLPWLIIGLPVGAWLDRLPARPVMVGCDLAAAALYASIPVAYAAGVLQIGQLVVVQLLAGVADVAFTTAYQLYLPCLVGGDQLTEANAKIQASYSTATLGGRGISGALTQLVGATASVTLNAISFLASAGCLLCIRTSERREQTRTRTSSVRHEILEAVTVVWRDPYLRPLTVFGGVANLALAAFAALVVVFLIRSVGLGAGLAGVLTALPGVGGLLAAALAAPLTTRIGSARAIRLAGALLPFALLAPLAEPGARLVCYIVGIPLAATGVSLATIIMSAFRQTYSPGGMLGRVTVTMRFVILRSQPARRPRWWRSRGLVGRTRRALDRPGRPRGLGGMLDHRRPAQHPRPAHPPINTTNRDHGGRSAVAASAPGIPLRVGVTDARLGDSLMHRTGDRATSCRSTLSGGEGSAI